MSSKYNTVKNALTQVHVVWNQVPAWKYKRYTETVMQLDGHIVSLQELHRACYHDPEMVFRLPPDINRELVKCFSDADADSLSRPALIAVAASEITNFLFEANTYEFNILNPRPRPAFKFDGHEFSFTVPRNFTMQNIGPAERMLYKQGLLTGAKAQYLLHLRICRDIVNSDKEEDHSDIDSQLRIVANTYLRPGEIFSYDNYLERLAMFSQAPTPLIMGACRYATTEVSNLIHSCKNKPRLLNIDTTEFDYKPNIQNN